MKSIVDGINYRVEKRTLYEDVASRMEQYILKNADRFGQRLPSEQALATNFGVSRPVIREALKILKERRLVESHNGDGSFIHKPDAQNLIDVIRRMIHMDSIDYVHVFNMRLLLEPYACRLAAESRVGAERIAEMAETIERMEASERNVDDRIHYDLAFHAIVAQCSGNPLLAAFVQSMTGLLTPIMRDALKPPEGHRSGLDYHRRLMELIVAGDGDTAERVMRDHLTEATQNYLKGRRSLAEGHAGDVGGGSAEAIRPSDLGG
jgi:GntR family transcriptional repressor for pyruvate dehydrogenase complex